MNKFIVRLPSGGHPSKAETSKKKQFPNYPIRTQVYLDLGQKSLGRSEKCPICDMVYITDDVDDVRSHSEFCREVNKVPTIPSLSGLNIVSKYSDKNEIVVKVTLGKSLHKVQIEEAIAHALRELGSSTNLVHKNDSIFFLLDRKGCILGILVCEQVVRTRCTTINSHEESASKIIFSSSEAMYEEASALKQISACPSRNNSKKIDQSVGTKRKRQGDSSAANNHDNVDAFDIGCETLIGEVCNVVLMGVKVVWVVASHRRQSVARRLLDTARRHFMYGTMVPVECVVFSQPTQAGFAFASRYCQRETVQAYA